MTDVIPQVLTSLDAYAERTNAYKDPKIHEKHIRAQKLLRAMIEHAPTAQGKENVAHAIIRCVSDDERLAELSIYYMNGFIFPIRAGAGRTPQVSEPPSRYSAERDREVNAELIESAKRDRGKLKHLVLRRDGYRCILTHKYDAETMMALPDITVPKGHCTYTEAAHIIPSSIINTDNKASPDKSSAVWEIIQMFTDISLNELNGDLINRMENVITLSSEVRIAFGKLHIWLEPISDPPNSYKMRILNHTFTSHPDGTVITLTTSDPTLPLPDPRYLGLHAACAKIAHASGVAKVIERYLQDMEETEMLASDGSSMQTLEQALSLVAIGVY